MKAFWNTGYKKAKHRLKVKDNFRIKLKVKKLEISKVFIQNWMYGFGLFKI